MKKKLFGENINVDCAYCENSVFEDGIVYCRKGRQIQKNKCRKFSYDPLMRVPKKPVLKNNYSADDFKL